jgi:hypothetical protein
MIMQAFRVVPVLFVLLTVAGAAVAQPRPSGPSGGAGASAWAPAAAEMAREALALVRAGRYDDAYQKLFAMEDAGYATSAGEVFFATGGDLLKGERWEAAVRPLEQARFLLDPAKSREAQFFLAFAWYRQGEKIMKAPGTPAYDRLHAALDAFETAKQLLPTSSHHQKAEVLTATEQYIANVRANISEAERAAATSRRRPEREVAAIINERVARGGRDRYSTSLSIEAILPFELHYPKLTQQALLELADEGRRNGLSGVMADALKHVSLYRANRGMGLDGITEYRFLSAAALLMQAEELSLASPSAPWTRSRARRALHLYDQAWEHAKDPPNTPEIIRMRELLQEGRAELRAVLRGP